MAGDGVERMKGPWAFELKLGLGEVVLKAFFLIEPMGVCRARDIRVGLRKEETDHSEHDPGSGFKSKKVP